MNHSDSERVAAVCERMGLEETSDHTNTDLLIFNTCSVRQAAEDKIFGLARLVKDLKSKKPDLQVIITGCMVLRGEGKRHEDWQKTLHERIPWADHLIPIKEMHNLPERLKDWLEVEDNAINEYFAIPPRYRSPVEAFIPISTGCDHFCTFCIVPFSRGREERRDAKSIIGEVKDLVERGYKDITLLGQIVNRWENPDTDSDIKTFPDLIRAINSIEGDFWFSFVSSHPNYMSEELIDTIARSKHCRPYFHFALQSGNDQMLRRMNRRHTIKEFVEICNKIKRNVPFLNLSTDIIVGFPGETKEQFLDTKRTMEELEFDMAYISEFSPRSNTAASLMKDDVPREIKQERKKILNDEVLAKTALKKNQQMIGRKFRAILRKVQDNLLHAKTENFKDITLSSPLSPRKEGEFVTVLIQNCNSWGLQGKIVE